MPVGYDLPTSMQTFMRSIPLVTYYMCNLERTKLWNQLLHACAIG